MFTLACYSVVCYPYHIPTDFQPNQFRSAETKICDYDIKVTPNKEFLVADGGLLERMVYMAALIPTTLPNKTSIRTGGEAEESSPVPCRPAHYRADTAPY